MKCFKGKRMKDGARPSDLPSAIFFKLLQFKIFTMPRYPILGNMLPHHRDYD